MCGESHQNREMSVDFVLWNVLTIVELIILPVRYRILNIDPFKNALRTTLELPLIFTVKHTLIIDIYLAKPPRILLEQIRFSIVNLKIVNEIFINIFCEYFFGC